MRLLAVIFVVAVCAMDASAAWAGWGCGAVSTRGAQGRSWGGTLEGAREAALRACTNENAGPCHIVSCRQPVDTMRKADALWPPNAPINCIGHC
jgi:hypothetical protein